MRFFQSFQILYCRIHVVHTCVKQEIVFHVNPVFGTNAVQHGVNDVHAFPMTLLLRAFHIIPNPAVILTHAVSLFNTGIIINAKPKIHIFHISPLVDNGVNGLLKQVVPLACSKREHDLHIFHAPVFKVVGRISGKVRPVQAKQGIPQIARAFSHLKSVSCSFCDILVQIDKHFMREPVLHHEVLIKHHVING